MRRFAFALCAVLLGVGLPRLGDGQTPGQALEPLPEPSRLDEDRVELGRLLFFDTRLSGDASMSCATCHQPDRTWTDGEALSKGYPGSLFFRRTPTLLGAALRRRLYWDGRLDVAELDSVARDHISEAHFMNADGRLVIERLRQVPEYEATFRRVMGSEPTYMKILSAFSEFVRSLRPDGGLLDRHLRTGRGLPAEAARGLDLFTGQAGCVRCHSGPLLTADSFPDLGVPENAAVFSDPLRHITFRRFFATLGVPGYSTLRRDLGRYAVTKDPEDRGAFRTPSLRAAGSQAAFMHNGAFRTLAEVVDFYDRGAGAHDGAALEPLGLTAADKAALVAFLTTLTAPAASAQAPQPDALPYAVRRRGRAGEGQ